MPSPAVTGVVVVTVSRLQEPFQQRCWVMEILQDVLCVFGMPYILSASVTKDHAQGFQRRQVRRLRLLA
jgi:hypothetical protein